MLFLNILPEKLKKEIKYSRINEVVRKIFLSLMVLCIVYTVSLVYSDYLLTDNIEIRKISIGGIFSKNNSAGETNKLLSRVDNISKVQSGFLNMSYIISDLINKSGDGISFNNLDINKETNKISISGVAKTRDDLLNFKNQLSESKNYSEINFPIENLLLKDNISFNISANIKSYEY